MLVSSPEPERSAPATNPGSAAERDLDAALAWAIKGAGRRGAGLEDLWHVAIGAEGELASSVDRRGRLLASLERLVDAGVARPMSKRRDGQDRTALPALPLVVRAVGAKPAERPESPSLPLNLRPELAGARDLARPRADEIVTLRAVNDFLRDFDPARPRVPARERSLEIFGDEKRLDALASQRLFTTGILTFDLLRCYEVHPPFVYQRLSDAQVALVIENHHTYDSARRVLEREARGARGVGVVAYGAGRAFCASVSYLGDLEPGVKFAYYFGDLDVAGLSIAISAAEAGQAAGVAPVVPAARLYKALLGSAGRRPGNPIDRAVADEVVGWLPAELRGEASALLVSGYWLPQEAVSLEVLDRLSDWL